MKKLLILDNYDSFTYNLFHYAEMTGMAEVFVCRNDEIELNKVSEFDGIILSPGPGLPHVSGIMPELIKQYHQQKKILGVCLGHQALAEFFGAKLENMQEVIHGRASEMCVIDNNSVLFQNIPKQFKAGRYHSWIVSEQNFPKELIITCRDSNSQIMGIRHRKWAIEGIQFHPESIMTEYGLEMIQNWMSNL